MGYSKSFYDSLKGNSIKREGFRNYYIPRIKEIYANSTKKLTSIIDIGCGTGMLLNTFFEADIDDYLGVDFCDFTSMIEIPDDKYLMYDLNNINQLRIGRKYDLACCLEVAEHLKEDSAEKLVSFLTDISEVVWFSAAVPYQCGEGHINEQWPEYWEDIFNQKGYVRVDFFRRDSWDRYELPGYYRQNMLIYINKSVITEFPLLNDFYMNHNDDLPKHLIHPTTYIYSANNYEMYRSK